MNRSGWRSGLAALVLAMASGMAPMEVLAQTPPATSPANAVVEADRILTIALEKGDRAAAERLLDADFGWVNPEGILLFKEDALRSGMRLLVGTGDGVEVIEHRYGSVAFVQRSEGKTKYSGRFWVQRPSGWRLLHVSDIEVRKRDYSPARPDFDVPCINPCRDIPWNPSGPGEKAFLEAWEEQESGAAGWVKHVADNYDQRPVNTYNGAAPSKADRIPLVQKAFSSPVSPAAPVLWVRSWDFGDAVVSIMLQPTYGDKAYWASRVYARINGVWQMAESYQNYIQSAPIMTAVPNSVSRDPRATNAR